MFWHTNSFSDCVTLINLVNNFDKRRPLIWWERNKKCVPTIDDGHTILEDKVGRTPAVTVIIVWHDRDSNVASSLHLLKYLQHVAHPCCVAGQLHYLLQAHTQTKDYLSIFTSNHSIKLGHSEGELWLIMIMIFSSIKKKLHFFYLLFFMFFSLFMGLFITSKIHQ